MPTFIWEFNSPPAPCPDVPWNTETFEPIILLNQIKLELDPTAEEFTPKEKVVSLNPNADVFKPLLDHPLKLRPQAVEFYPAGLNPKATEFKPTVTESTLDPNAKCFVMYETRQKNEDKLNEEKATTIETDFESLKEELKSTILKNFAMQKDVKEMKSILEEKTLLFTKKQEETKAFIVSNIFFSC